MNPEDAYAAEVIYLVDDRKLYVHSEQLCTSFTQEAYCPIHNPSDHPLAEAPFIWRDDRGILERMCPCGIGHPDPDQPFRSEADRIHGCCGHCGPQGPWTPDTTDNEET